MKTILLLLTLSVGLGIPAMAADEGACKPVLDASIKVILVPTHVYSTENADFHKGKIENSEMIYSGGANGSIYILVAGKWSRSKMTAADMVKQQEENRRSQKSTCRYLRDEAVNGEAASVYAAHSDNEDTKIDVTFWLSKSKNLPLKEEIDMDVGGAMGKSHRAMRFEYSNVHAPAGVQ